MNYYIKFIIIVIIVLIILMNHYIPLKLKKMFKNIKKAYDEASSCENTNNDEHELKTEKTKADQSKSQCDNDTMIQYFEWYYPNSGILWDEVKNEAGNLSAAGITSIWLPPAYKCHNGINDVGYGAYDLYDLGEFNQKGTIRTKYGTKEQYIEAINEAHKYNIKVLGDVVFNHKAGADSTETVMAREVDENDRNKYIGEPKEIKAHTIFNFPGRKEMYSDYIWSAKDFDGVDYDEFSKKQGIYKFEGKEWESDVDDEKGNYDFLMFDDLDMDSEDVNNELIRWGTWYVNATNIDGFRFDAIKHIKFDFFTNWLNEVKKNTHKNFLSVGEYWSWDVYKLKYYLKKCNYCMKLFDVPLHFNLQRASNSYGSYDMRRILDNTLVKDMPQYAVTFVDNHDTEIGQSLESWVEPWFKPLAYTFILTRDLGTPCVFYGDYKGIPSKNYSGIHDELNRILKIRKDYAYGIQHDYFDHDSIIGWTREGDLYHKDSGMAALITNAFGGLKEMYVGKNHQGEEWIDITGKIKNHIIIDDNGIGVFKVYDGSYSIWTKKKM